MLEESFGNNTKLKTHDSMSQVIVILNNNNHGMKHSYVSDIDTPYTYQEVNQEMLEYVKLL